jgi:hypothetical protein
LVSVTRSCRCLLCVFRAPLQLCVMRCWRSISNLSRAMVGCGCRCFEEFSWGTKTSNGNGIDSNDSKFRAKENKTLRDPDRWSTATSNFDITVKPLFLLSRKANTPWRIGFAPLTSRQFVKSSYRRYASFSLSSDDELSIYFDYSRGKYSNAHQTTKSGRVYRWWPPPSSSSSQESDSHRILPSSWHHLSRGFTMDRPTTERAPSGASWSAVA